MPLLNVFDVSGSAMSAQTVRLNTTASNLANAQSVASSVDETYRARHPVFAAQLDNALDQHRASSSAGVDVLGIVESDAPLDMRFEPEHPMADENGYVAYPNVNVVEEMANMISASRSFELNVDMMTSAKSLTERLLRLGQ
ncbi:MAG: flagellar basal body rod protein FlgC [Pseudomonadaceae bacterium]|nr:flagellar basal body rod protein FlgC [Pseudomonadaceae bacterium]